MRLSRFSNRAVFLKWSPYTITKTKAKQLFYYRHSSRKSSSHHSSFRPSAFRVATDPFMSLTHLGLMSMLMPTAVEPKSRNAFTYTHVHTHTHMYGPWLCAPSGLWPSPRPCSKSVIVPAVLEWPFPPLTPRPLCWLLLTIWEPQCDTYTRASSQTRCPDRNTLSQSGSSRDSMLRNHLGVMNRWSSDPAILQFQTSNSLHSL